MIGFHCKNSCILFYFIVFLLLFIDQVNLYVAAMLSIFVPTLKWQFVSMCLLRSWKKSQREIADLLPIFMVTILGLLLVSLYCSIENTIAILLYLGKTWSSQQCTWPCNLSAFVIALLPRKKNTPNQLATIPSSGNQKSKKVVVLSSYQAEYISMAISACQGTISIQKKILILNVMFYSTINLDESLYKFIVLENNLIQ